VAAAAALLLVIAGCGQTPAIQTRSASPVSTSVAPTSPRSASPSAETAGDIRVHEIPQRFTTPALAYETDGRAIFWSSGAGGGENATAADLWEFVPGQRSPQKVFANPRRDSSLPLLRGDGQGHYVFVEQNARLYGDAGWRLWYLDPPHDPVLLDKSDVDEGLLPFPSLTSDSIVWAVLHTTNHGVMSQLIEQSQPRETPRLLAEADAKQREFLFPSLAGSRLAYTTIDANSDRTKLSSSVWLWDVSGAGQPHRLNPEGDDAFCGVLGSGVVVWQAPALETPFNGGDVELYDLGTNSTERILSASRMTTWQTVGNRFVVAESENIGEVRAYDLLTRTEFQIDHTPRAAEGERDAIDVRPRVAGDLLIFIRGSDNPDKHLSLRWVQLPGTEPDPANSTSAP
jgi:hypothetical protein